MTWLKYLPECINAKIANNHLRNDIQKSKSTARELFDYSKYQLIDGKKSLKSTDSHQIVQLPWSNVIHQINETGFHLAEMKHEGKTLYIPTKNRRFLFLSNFSAI